MTANNKRLLVLVDWFYPGYKAGGPIQSCRNLVAALGKDREIFILTSDRDLGDHQGYPGIRPDCWVDYEQGAKVFYASALSYQQLISLVKEIRPDYLYVNSLFSYRFAILPLLARWRVKDFVELVLAPRGMLQAGAIRFKPLKKKLFIFLINRCGLPRKLVFHATDDQEAVDIRAYFPRAAKVVTVSNFPPLQAAENATPQKERGRLQALFLSRVAPKKNLLFLLQLLKGWPGHLQLNLSIGGGVEQPAYWQQCQQEIGQLPATVRVEVLGPIPHEQVVPLIRRQQVYILPTLGENFGHSIFEAFAAGRPVLISDRTPWRGLENRQAGWDLSLENPAAFLAVLEKLAAMDSTEISGWYQGARAFYETAIRQSDLKEQYLKLFS